MRIEGRVLHGKADAVDEDGNHDGELKEPVVAHVVDAGPKAVFCGEEPKHLPCAQIAVLLANLSPRLQPRSPRCILRHGTTREATDAERPAEDVSRGDEEMGSAWREDKRSRRWAEAEG